MTFTKEELEFIQKEMEFRAKYAPEENTLKENVLYFNIDYKLKKELLSLLRSELNNKQNAIDGGDIDLYLKTDYMDDYHEDDMMGDDNIGGMNPPENNEHPWNDGVDNEEDKF